MGFYESNAGKLMFIRVFGMPRECIVEAPFLCPGWDEKNLKLFYNIFIAIEHVLRHAVGQERRLCTVL